MALKSVLLLCSMLFAALIVAGVAAADEHDSRSVFVHPQVGGFLAQAVHPGESPCEDPLYLELLEKPLDEMSDREYEYFVRKDKECDQYRQHTATQPEGDAPPPVAASQPATGQVQRAQGMSSGAIIAMSILGTIGFLVFLGAVAS